jgi:hypothetical protein
VHLLSGVPVCATRQSKDATDYDLPEIGSGVNDLEDFARRYTSYSRLIQPGLIGSADGALHQDQ